MGEPWKFDPQHSSIRFSVRHMVIAKVHGTFTKWSGDVAFTPEDLGRSKVTVSIDAASIDTQVAERDQHLRSPDFLDVATYPQITLASKRVEKSDENRYRVVGDLTIHGVTREAVLDVEHAGQAKDPWGNVRAGFSARTTIDRKDFGLKWNQVLETGGLLVGDKVEITAEIELVKTA